jgi:hypothetical protein
MMVESAASMHVPGVVLAESGTSAEVLGEVMVIPETSARVPGVVLVESGTSAHVPWGGLHYLAMNRRQRVQPCTWPHQPGRVLHMSTALMST